MLEFEKIDTNKKNVTLKPVNINDLLVKECVSFQSYCDKKQLHIKISLPEHDVFAMADEQMMEMLLDNLISNACKYTLANGTISLSLLSDKKNVVIEVQDTVLAFRLMPADSCSRMFIVLLMQDRQTNPARIRAVAGTAFGEYDAWQNFIQI